MKVVQISDYKIGRGYSPFIIAEAGINHNGELQTALEMIKIAKREGANAVKFQTFKAEEFIADPTQTYTYKSQGKEITESMLEMVKRYEFSKDEWFQIKRKCDDEDILFLSTPLNKSDLDLLLEVGISAIKIASMNLTDIPLLKTCSKTGLPIIFSCGMSYMSEVQDALHAIGALDGYPTILLLTTSQYPTPPEDVNLLKLRTLSNEFPMIPMGLSDHTQGPLASSLAVAFGACVFEKHFTLDHNFSGPDHWFSEDPEGLKLWIKGIKTAYKMLGSEIVCPTSVEMHNKKEFQKVIVANKRIKCGEVFDLENIVMKRVKEGKGLSPRLYETLLGKKANKDYNEGSAIEE